MRTRRRDSIRRSRGQASVEFALVTGLVLIPVLFTIFDFGIVLSDWVSATTAASVGARQAAVGACLDGPTSDPTVCASTNATSILGGVMQSAPVLAADGNCVNPPSPTSAYHCAARVDIGVVDLNSGMANCEGAEVWLSTQQVQAGSTSTVIITSTSTWGPNTLVGSELVFNNGANANAGRTVTANTSSTITVSPAFQSAPAAGDTLLVRTMTVAPITSGWLATCSATPLDPQINDTLAVYVHSLVELPVRLPGLPPSVPVETSSTVRYEGVYVP